MRCVAVQVIVEGAAGPLVQGLKNGAPMRVREACAIALADAVWNSAPAAAAVAAAGGIPPLVELLTDGRCASSRRGRCALATLL